MKSLFRNRSWLGFRRARWVACVLGLMAAGSIYFLYQIHKNVAALTIDSMPGGRLANNLIEQAAVCEIARLRGAEWAGDTNSANPVAEGLRAMAGALQEYRLSVYSEPDLRNWESANAAYNRYAAGAPRAGREDMVVQRAYEDMRSAFLVLRDYNRERSHQLVATSGEQINKAVKWNIGFAAFLAVFVSGAVVYFSIRSVRDVAPDDF